jgi:hypothetical protein
MSFVLRPLRDFLAIILDNAPRKRIERVGYISFLRSIRGGLLEFPPPFAIVSYHLGLFVKYEAIL